MKHYEYDVTQLIYPAQLEDFLNQQAKQGWRFVGYSDHVVILEREYR